MRLVAIVLMLTLPPGVCRARADAEQNWPRFRGPAGNAAADLGSLPLKWDGTKNVRWKVPIPGEGFSSPTIWRGRSLLTAASPNGK